MSLVFFCQKINRTWSLQNILSVTGYIKLKTNKITLATVEYVEPCQTHMKELFVKIS